MTSQTNLPATLAYAMADTGTCPPESGEAVDPYKLGFEIVEKEGTIPPHSNPLFAATDHGDYVYWKVAPKDAPRDEKAIARRKKKSRAAARVAKQSRKKQRK